MASPLRPGRPTRRGRKPPQPALVPIRQPSHVRGEGRAGASLPHRRPGLSRPELPGQDTLCPCRRGHDADGVLHRISALRAQGGNTSLPVHRPRGDTHPAEPLLHRGHVPDLLHRGFRVLHGTTDARRAAEGLRSGRGLHRAGVGLQGKRCAPVPGLRAGPRHLRVLRPRGEALPGKAVPPRPGQGRPRPFAGRRGIHVDLLHRHAIRLPGLVKANSLRGPLPFPGVPRPELLRLRPGRRVRDGARHIGAAIHPAVHRHHALLVPYPTAGPVRPGASPGHSRLGFHPVHGRPGSSPPPQGRPAAPGLGTPLLPADGLRGGEVPAVHAAPDPVPAHHGVSYAPLGARPGIGAEHPASPTGALGHWVRNRSHGVLQPRLRLHIQPAAHRNEGVRVDQREHRQRLRDTHGALGGGVAEHAQATSEAAAAFRTTPGPA